MKQICLFISIILFSCDESNETVKDNSTETVDMDDWKEKFYLRGTSNSIDAQTGLPIKHKIIDGATFAYVENDSGLLVKEWTDDTLYKTPEGYSVGTRWGDLPDSLKNKHYILPGWGIYIDLKDNWRLCFCVGQSCTDSIPSESEKVKWIQHNTW